MPFWFMIISKCTSLIVEHRRLDTCLVHLAGFFFLLALDFTCLVAYLDVNSVLKARLVLEQRFKNVLNVTWARFAHRVLLHYTPVPLLQGNNSDDNRCLLRLCRTVALCSFFLEVFFSKSK